MAYGVKYRLDFSDDETNKKRIDIAQDGYVGGITNMVGGESPCIITYQQDDDVYSPIIASSAKINLYVTDSVSYDDLQTEDEREFKVTVYFWDNTYSNYVVYWQGYLIPDAYQEVISTTPYKFSVTATDGLGALKGELHELKVAKYNLKSIIEHCLDFTDLGLNYIYDIMLDLQSSISDYNSALLFTYIYSDAYFDTKKMPLSCKDVLESILKKFNLRVYQRRGYYDGLTLFPNKWVIQTNAKPLDNTYQTSYTIPADLKPIYDDLMRYKKGSLKKVSNTNDVKKQVNPVRNGAFENGDLTAGHWTSASGFIGGNSNKGLYSYYFSEKVTVGTFTEQLSQGKMLPYIAQDTEFTLKFDYTFDNANFPTNEAEYGMHYVLRAKKGTTSDYVYYDQPNDAWVTTLTYNQFTYKGRGEWETFSQNITTPSDLGDGTTSGNPNHLELYFYRPYLNSGGTHLNTYLDGIAIELTKWNAEFGVSGESTYNYLYEKEINSNTATGNKSREEEYKDMQENNIDNKYIAGKLIDDASAGDEVARFVRFVGDTASLIDEVSLLQKVNDARNGLISYEGTLKKFNDERPLCLGDYASISFTTLTESDPLIIDTMEYNVKRNAYKIFGHIQVQGTDESTTTFTNYE